MWNFLTAANRAVLVLGNLALMLIVVASVFSRYVFAYDLYGAEEFLMIFAFWLYFGGAAYGSFQKSHVEADFVHAWLGDCRTTRVIGLLRDMIELGVLCVLTHWSFMLIQFAVVRWPVTPGWKMPLLLPQMAILTGFAMMTAYSLMHLVQRFRSDVREV